MAEYYVLAAEIEEHRRADLPGECAFCFRIKVLRAEGDAAALENLPDKGEVRKRRTDADANTVFHAETIYDRFGQPGGFGSGGMHLPISDNEFLAHVRFHGVVTKTWADDPRRGALSLPCASIAVSQVPRRAARLHLAR